MAVTVAIYQHDPGNVLIGHAGPACDVDKMFYPYITE
jgi:hypothetical protein